MKDLLSRIEIRTFTNLTYQDMNSRSLIFIFQVVLLLISLSAFSQETLSHKVKNMHHHERSKIKQMAYQFLITWNSSAGRIKPASHELKAKIKENKHKGRDHNKGTEKLRKALDEAILADGNERSFIAQEFSIPMLEELSTKGLSLDASDIYTAQYVIKYPLGVPRFNHGELDIDNLDQMERELKNLVETYPDNDAETHQKADGSITLFRQESQAYFQTFVAKNRAQYEKGGDKENTVSGLSQMSCGEKLEYLKEKGIMP
ncbi:MAG: hypothetical protein JXR03_01900 [Cyclobacteriaceae bacterium]